MSAGVLRLQSPKFILYIKKQKSIQNNGVTPSTNMNELNEYLILPGIF